MDKKGLSDTLSGKCLSGEIFVRRNYSSGEIFVTKWKIHHFRQAKFSSPNEKFVIFARRKISPNRSKSVFKWSANEPMRETSNLNKIVIILLGETLSGEILVGRNYSSSEIFLTFSKNSLLSTDKVSPDKVT